MFLGARALKTLQKQVFWTDVYSKKRVNYRMLDWKHYKNTVKSNVLEGFTAFMAKNVYITVCLTGNIGKTLSKTMFWKDFLYIYICWSWLPALEHGKIEENTVNSGIFNGWGDKGIGCIVEHLWRQKCKVLCLFEGNHCKNMETPSKNTGFGGLGVVV